MSIAGSQYLITLDYTVLPVTVSTLYCSWGLAGIAFVLTVGMVSSLVNCLGFANKNRFFCRET